MPPRPAHSWRWLLANFLKREVESRYTGSVGGIFWALANPLVQLALYARYGIRPASMDAGAAIIGPAEADRVLELSRKGYR